jgi:hypothetical protein
MTAAPEPPFTLITTLLPGPDRKRTPAPYHFRVTYRNPDPADCGCVATWEVRGGREEYQVALERPAPGELVWHCSCPDAVYHEDYRNAHHCKHVRGLVGVFETIGNPVRRHSAKSAA